MRQISSALLISLSFVIGGCNWFGDGGSNNIVAPSPVIVQAMVLPTIVEYSGSCLVSWKTENSTKTKVDGVQVNGSSVELKNLTENRAIEIIAYGGEGTLPASKVIQIVVSQPVQPVVFTASDTLCSGSGSWIETSMFLSIDNGISWKDEVPDPKYDHIKKVFSSDHKFVSYLYPYTGDKFENSVWRIENRNLILGEGKGEIYKFILKDNVLTLFITKEGADSKGNIFPAIHKTVYTKDK